MREGIGMGHTRLSILDLTPSGDQPMEGEEWVLSFNGEIYNHLGLRSMYDLSCKGISDTATLLAMLEEMGINATLPLLRGMWAFAAYHKPTRTLYCAVDPFGIKPLHYCATDDFFAVASSPSAILPLRPKWKIRPEGLMEFMMTGGAEGVWHGIGRLSGGTMVVKSPEGLSFQRWYVPTFQPNAEALIGDALDRAMQQVQLSDVPVGLFYSGGVDSSVVASFMPKGTPSFHLNGAEAMYAEAGAEHFGHEFHLIDNAGASVQNALRTIARTSGEPTMAGYIPFIVSAYASDHVKVAISANGADELFFGYPRTLDGQDTHMFRDPRSFTLRGKAKATVPKVYALTGDGWPEDAIPRWRELMYYIALDLNPTLDAASMAHSLELRVPFLDQDLVECALSLPAAWHGTKDYLKVYLREVGLPSEIWDRPKEGFSMPATDRRHRAYQDTALRYMRQVYGFIINPKANARDRAYLTNCATGWYAFEQEHEHLIDR